MKNEIIRKVYHIKQGVFESWKHTYLCGWQPFNTENTRPSELEYVELTHDMELGESGFIGLYGPYVKW